MQKKTKDKHSKESVKEEFAEKTSWNNDQKSRRYYYDDAHGYEIYCPEEDEPSTDDLSPDVNTSPQRTEK
jgi:hypothetical protein